MDTRSALCEGAGATFHASRWFVLTTELAALTVALSRLGGVIVAMLAARLTGVPGAMCAPNGRASKNLAAWKRVAVQVIASLASLCCKTSDFVLLERGVLCWNFGDASLSARV